MSQPPAFKIGIPQQIGMNSKRSKGTHPGKVQDLFQSFLILSGIHDSV